ncbi:protein SHOOT GRAVITROPISM 5 [Quillaja saponaria]|uniref:Protein SHOOT GRAVITROPISM 5 n=1 Tax=Quillaja saponaria TaxID=32244 RepID=A0AAD7LDC0_QUISA|nr:protein SHOOT GRAVITROPISM 5 [Quillaja saponaria]
MEEDDQKELQLLPTPRSIASTSRMSSRPSDSSSLRLRSTVSTTSDHIHQGTRPASLDLQLSISLRPIRPPPLDCGVAGPIGDYDDVDNAKPDMLKWQAAEQIRLAAMEKAYAERVRELTRREMELAQSEFERARHMWERARAEVEKAERMKERATRNTDSTCMEITCHSCRQRFRP